jgi:iron complex transport system substrate-binding protein
MSNDTTSATVSASILQSPGKGERDDEDTSAGEGRMNNIRIVSLLPSITEVLSSLGKDVAHQIVGITHECDYPPSALKGAQIVTVSDISPHSMTQAQIHEQVTGSLINGHSLYGLNKQVLQTIQPDIIFTQSLCDVCAVSYPVVVETCAKILGGGGDNAKNNGPTIISLEPNNLKDVLTTFTVAARALGLADRAQQVVEDLQRNFRVVRETVERHLQMPSSTVAIRKTGTNSSKPVVVFLEWHDPFFTGGHWIADLMEIAGCDYRMCQSGDRSAALKDDDFIAMDPDYILIGPCGFSLDRALEDTKNITLKRPWWKTLRAVQTGNVYALDGNSYYARPGPRLLQGCGLIARCVHGEDVGKALGEELAPSSGMQRVTIDMYA